jgi:hypothetical protein
MTEWSCKQCVKPCKLKVAGRKSGWLPILCVFDVRDENERLKRADWRVVTR